MPRNLVFDSQMAGAWATFVMRGIPEVRSAGNCRSSSRWFEACFGDSTVAGIRAVSANGSRTAWQSLLSLRIRVVYFTLLSLVAIGVPCSAQNELTQSLRNQALPAWDKYKAQIQKLSGDIHETIKVPARGTRPAITRRRDIKFYFRDNLVRFEITRVPSNGELTVYAQNPSDRFEIDRDGAGLGLYVGDYAPKDEQTSNTDDALAFYLRLPLAGLYVASHDLSSLIRQGRIQVKKLNPKDDQGRAEATLRISNGTAQPVDYRVVFLPDQSWLVSEWEGETSTAKLHAQVTYSESALCGVYPKSFYDETLGKKGALAERREYYFDAPKPCVAADNSFTLSFYGLQPADFSGFKGKPNWWHRSLLALNTLVVLALAIFIWIHWRRAVRTTTD